jgi:hypothetical protein
LKVRPLAICTADFPNDSVETEDGKGFLDHGGRNVAEAVAEILSRLGCTISAPENAAEYGWRFGWAFGGQTFFCQVSSIPPEYYLHFDGVSFRRNVSPKSRPAHAEIMTALNAELARDERFHDVLWYPCVGGVVRLEDEAAATSPLAPPPITQPTRAARWILFLAAWVGLLMGLMLVDRGSAIGFATLLVSAILLLGSGLISGRWLRPLYKRAAAADEKTPPK